MRVQSFVLAGALMLCGCVQAEPAAPAEQATELVREDTAAVGDGVYTVRQIGVEGSAEGRPVLDRVEILQNGGSLQSFADFRFDAEPPLGGGFQAGDLNFDGWTDFRLFGGFSNAGEWWYCWLWDPETGAFVYDAALSDLRECVWDAAGREIYTAEYAGLSGGTYGVYAWEEGELVCVRRFTISINIYEPPFLVENRYECRRDGELQVEQTWQGVYGDWGDALVAPEAKEFLETVTFQEIFGKE